VEAVNAIIKKQQDGGSEDEEEEDDEEVEWGGLDGGAEARPTKPTIPMEGQEDEYVDEDRYTTVTVEPMSVHDNNDAKEDVDPEDAVPAQEGTEDDGKKKKRIWTKEKPPSDKKKKPKKAKFRYESKADRKSIRTKQSLKNKAQARARKGE
jgi:ribosomal RNA-processing protein 17